HRSYRLLKQSSSKGDAENGGYYHADWHCHCTCQRGREMRSK
ncbi:hypothetical protein GCK32_019866, partial [Trichostrongylus colubriformis]